MTTSRPDRFVAVLPKSLRYGDEIIIKGKIQEAAKQFSINFTVDNSTNPSRVAYHFKTIFDRNIVVHNYKNCTWMDEIEESNTWIDGPGEEFILTFHFESSEIIIYTGDDTREFQYQFEHRFPIDTISTVQVWDDVNVEDVNEITFRYTRND